MGRIYGALILGLVMALGPVFAGEDQPAAASQNRDDGLRMAKQSAVLILVGDGGGRLASINTGVIVRSDGIILAAYHSLRGVPEVQVRLRNGEVYDRVDLVDFDERRDVVALHIPAQGLPSATLATPGETVPGEKVFLLRNPAGMGWTFSDGVLGSTRLADEVAGAGHGFRVVQFLASVAPDTGGGTLLNLKGQVLGILAGSPGATGPAWAIPVESVVGLAAQASRTPLGAGKDLELSNRTPGAGGTGNQGSYGALMKARTLRVHSRTTSFTAFMLEKELVNHPEFRGFGLDVVNGSHKVDLTVDIDRPLLTYDFTFSVADGHTGAVVAAGKVTAIDGPHAAHGIAKQIVLELEKARSVDAAEAGK